MESVQKCAAIFSAWILWVFALTAALAWYTFGYVDLTVLRGMILLLLPLLALSVVLLLWSDRPHKSTADENAHDSSANDPRIGKKGVRHADAH